MVLVPFLFPRSPHGFTVHHEAKSASEDHEDEDQEYKLLHNAILCCCIPDTLLAQKGCAMARGEEKDYPLTPPPSIRDVRAGGERDF
jgi:hypothetical protein